MPIEKDLTGLRNYKNERIKNAHDILLSYNPSGRNYLVFNDEMTLHPEALKRAYLANKPTGEESFNNTLEAMAKNIAYDVIRAGCTPVLPKWWEQILESFKKPQGLLDQAAKETLLNVQTATTKIDPRNAKRKHTFNEYFRKEMIEELLDLVENVANPISKSIEVAIKSDNFSAPIFVKKPIFNNVVEIVKNTFRRQLTPLTKEHGEMLLRKFAREADLLKGNFRQEKPATKQLDPD